MAPIKLEENEQANCRVQDVFSREHQIHTEALLELNDSYLAWSSKDLLCEFDAPYCVYPALCGASLFIFLKLNGCN